VVPLLAVDEALERVADLDIEVLDLT